MGLDQVMSFRLKAAPTIGAQWITADMPEVDAGLLQWVVSSNRCLLEPLEERQRVSNFSTKFQYLLISGAPEREDRFQELKKKYGSMFAYHGSAAENWHSILRNGLKNASNTNLMSAGAVHGAGIYMAKNMSTSIGYARGTHMYHRRDVAPTDIVPEPGRLERVQTGNRCIEDITGLVALAICEVI